MADSSKTVGSVCFGPYELSLDCEELRKGGNRLKLTGQAIQVLVVLANNAGKLVTREELQQKLWPGATYGDFEHGLNAAVNRLRETLGDSATDPKYIETIPRRGYRFIAALEPVVAPQPGPPREELKPPKPTWWKRKATIAAAACVVIAGTLYPWIKPKIERLLRLYDLQRLTVVPLTALPGNAWSPTFSPDGSQLAILDHPANSPSRPVRLFVLSLDSMEKVLVKTDCNSVAAPAFSPSGDYLAWACGDDMSSVSIHLQRRSDGGVTQLVHGVDGVGGLAWSRDSRRIVFSTSFNGGDLWEVALTRPNHPEKLPIGHDASDIAVSPTGNR